MDKGPVILLDNLTSDVRGIIEYGRKQAYDAVGQATIFTFWNIGKRIVEE